MDRIVYEVVESRDYPDHWQVEAIDDESTVFIGRFSGPKAQERAREFADLKNRVPKCAPVVTSLKRTAHATGRVLGSYNKSAKI
jgi:hypothetical protein